MLLATAYRKPTGRLFLRGVGAPLLYNADMKANGIILSRGNRDGGYGLGHRTGQDRSGRVRGWEAVRRGGDGILRAGSPLS